MVKEWTPSYWGRRLTGSPNWRLRMNGLELILEVNNYVHRITAKDEGVCRINSGIFWTDITLFLEQGMKVKVDGLPNVRRDSLSEALKNERRISDDVAYAQETLRKIREWLQLKMDLEQTARDERRWLTHEMLVTVRDARPKFDRKGITLLSNPEVRARLGRQVVGVDISDVMQKWMEADPSPRWGLLNLEHTERELNDCKDLFDRVESKSLTQEQAIAVICFDNRVQVVAAAGSGKTSTMVAKAAYAIHRGFVGPERIVLLAFNKQAADELKERAARSFERLRMDGIAVETSTFHALGLRIIGMATGEKPDIPEWATDNASGLRKLTDLIDRLKDDSVTFRTQWDLFRFVFGRDLPAMGVHTVADMWDSEGNGYVRTTKGEAVKSQEESMIANWLFYNGVEYNYEARYEHHTASEKRRQYRPDFYYPDIDLYHEHFALDAHGQAPDHFEGYQEGVLWKRQLHYDKNTSLFETSSHGLRNGDDFQRLAAELTSRGIELDPNPDREIPFNGQKPMEAGELIALVRTFISHVKSNCLTVNTLRERLDAMPEDTFKHRHRMFLDIATPILEAWDAALKAEGGIDFEDMLNLAAEHLESGRYDALYELVMADEFQDASRARARLCRALVQKPGRFLFAVGDDWQSINRFAGADVSVMTNFQQWFGHGQILKLEQTFRCPQELCDVSSRFITKNPAQISKGVRSVTPTHGPVIQAFQVDGKNKLADAIDQFVMKLAEGVQNGEIEPQRDGKVSVFVLGRYNADRQYVPGRRARFDRWVDVSFLTIHRSKGSEADYVILPEMLSVARGRSFPNNRADDPVLALAMPDSDIYPFSEERRLFYVALTRARRSVTMFTVRGQCSVFLRELVEEDTHLVIADIDGKEIREENCPSCKHGVLVLRTGPYGEFRSCSNYPSCAYKPKERGGSGQIFKQQSKQYNPFSATVGRERATDVVPSLRPSVLAEAERPKRSPPDICPQPRPTMPEQTKKSKSTSRFSLSAVLSSANKAVEDFNCFVTQQSAIQNATSSLELDIRAEKLVINHVLNGAKSDFELEEKLKSKGPHYRDLYEKNYKEISQLLEEDTEQFPSLGRPVPTFQRAIHHSDPDTDNAIQQKFNRLREDRETFLTVVRAELNSDPVVRGYFLKGLQEIDCMHYLIDLDPMSSWRLP